MFIFAAQIKPGDYDRLLVAVDGNMVTGYFSDCTGACKFECNFVFAGNATANRFTVAAHAAGDTDIIRGEVTAAGNKLNLVLEKLPGGCWNVAPELNRSGAELLLHQKEDWLQIRMLRERSYLHNRPRGTKTIPLEKQQTVIVLKKQGEWFYVRKPGAENTHGWLPPGVLYPLFGP